MDFEVWKPVYETILDDFGFDRVADECARDALASLVERFDLTRLDCSDETVVIAGAGPSLENELDRISEKRIFAASTATDRLREAGIAVECMVTDLDKNPDTARELTARGTPVAVHAHGDNLELLQEVVPKLDTRNVLGTTQASPVADVKNFGGFTDGDRAAFLADYCGARRLQFVGWDFEDPSVNVEKERKLAWAAQLLYWLERRRGERFSILDGQRDELDTSALPVG